MAAARAAEAEIMAGRLRGKLHGVSERPLRGFETASDHGRRSCDGGPSFAALLASADQAAINPE
jgi:hypothetical protein